MGLGVGLTALVAVAALPALAQTQSRPTAQAPGASPAEPQAESGKALAQRLCSNCHVVQDGAGASVPAGVPPMRAIANRPGQTGARIKEMLIAPPHQMPDMQLTLQEIEDLLAFLQSLRNDPAAPPFNPEGVPKLKSPYPKAS